MLQSNRRTVLPRAAVVMFLVAACGGKPPAQGPENSAAPSAAPASTPAPGVEESAAPAAEPGAASVAAGDKPDDDAPADAKGPHEFKSLDTHTAKGTQGVETSQLKPTKTDALVKLVVVDKDKGPMAGIAISLTGADGKKYYAKETDAVGYTELLVPMGQKYDIVYLSLGHSDVAATTTLESKANLTMKLTLRFKGWSGAEPSAASGRPVFVLDGVNFDTGKATIRKESFPRLDGVVEYLTHKKSARIEISGHTDNVGNPKANKTLSEKRAEACRDYLVSKGIDGTRIQAVGLGDERPMAPNDTEAGRQKNRRIEATEL